MNNLIKFYNESNASIGIFQGEDSRLHFSVTADRELTAKNALVVTVKRGKESLTLPVVMPNKDILKLEEDGTLIKFNPMAENALAHRPSEVQNRLVVSMSARIVVASIGILKGLLAIALNTEAHDQLPPALFELIRTLPVVDKPRTAEKVNKYVNAVIDQTTGFVGKKAIGRFKQVRNIEAGDQKYARGTTYVPVLLGLVDQETPFNIAVPNKAAKAMLNGLINILFAGMNSTIGTNDTVAPYYQTSLASFAAVAKHLNNISIAVGTNRDDLAIIDTGWTKDFGNLGNWYQSELNIRFAGNIGPLDGDIEAEEEAKAETANRDDKVLNPNIAVQQSAPQPAVNSQVGEVKQPAESKKETKQMQLISVAELAAQGTNVRMNAPVSEVVPSVAVSNNSKLAIERTTKPAQTQHKPAATNTSHHLKIERRQQSPLNDPNKIQLRCADGRPLTTANGQPFMVDKSEVPDFQIMQKNNGGQLIFNADGTPALIEAPAPNMATGGYPVANTTDPATAYFKNKAQQSNMVAGGYNPNVPQYTPAPQYAPAPQYQNAPQYSNMVPVYNNVAPYNPYANAPQQAANTLNLAPTVNYHSM